MHNPKQAAFSPEDSEDAECITHPDANSCQASADADSDRGLYRLYEK